MVYITYGSLAAHNAQILTGFNILTKGTCVISPKLDPNLPPCVVLADFGDKKVAYDTCDGYFHVGAICTDKRYESLSDQVDIIYKRDFTFEVKRSALLYRGGVRPLGLNYFCYDNRIKKLYYPGIRFVKKELQNLLSLCDENWKNFEVEQISAQSSCDVLFLTRLWNPGSSEVENQETAQDRENVNLTRIAIIRELRRRYGDKAICGLSDDEYSRKVAPDLINKEYTKKQNYLNIMKNAKVVIGSLGLHKSNGWKIGEYMAAGRPIVMEKPYYEIPFAEKNTNYLEYATHEECINDIEQLLQNDRMRQEIAKNNCKFYSEHLRPDKLIEDTLILERIQI